MKAIVMTATGTPEVLHYQEIPEPTLKNPHDMLVRIKAAGVNPVDTKLRNNGVYFPEQMPAILGCDGAGIVEQIGSAVTRFKPGDSIYYCSGGIGRPPGNYAEAALVDERVAAHKPANLSFTEAAAIPLVLITAWESLHDRGAIQAGQQVLIHAGAGGVGHIAIQLARLAGASVCTTIGSAEKLEFVTSLGAEKAINYKQQDFVTVAQEWTNHRGVALALDTVGGATFEHTIAAMATYGDLVTLLQPPSGMEWKSARIKNLRISLELMLTPMLQQDISAQQHQAWILEQCAPLFDDHSLRIHVEKVLPLEQAAQAHRLIEQGSMTGKIVLEMGT